MRGEICDDEDGGCRRLGEMAVEEGEDEVAVHGISGRGKMETYLRPAFAWFDRKLGMGGVCWPSW